MTIWRLLFIFTLGVRLVQSVENYRHPIRGSSVWEYFNPPFPQRVPPHQPEQSPMEAMVDITNNLGVAILRDHSFSRGNFAFSPYGVASVLVLLYEGSQGTSARQIHRAVGFPSNKDIIRMGFRDIHRHLRSYFNHEGYLSGITLNKNDSSLKPEYKKILRFYGYDVDMNQAVEKNRHGESGTSGAEVGSSPVTTPRVLDASSNISTTSTHLNQSEGMTTPNLLNESQMMGATTTMGSQQVLKKEEQTTVPSLEENTTIHRTENNTKVGIYDKNSIKRNERANDTEEHTQSIRKDVETTVADTTAEDHTQSIRKDVETTAAGTTTEEHTQSIRKDVETTVAGTTTEKHIQAEGCEKTVVDTTTEEHIQSIRKDVEPTVADTPTENLIQSIRKDVDATVADTTTEEHIQSIRKEVDATVSDTTAEEHTQSIRKDEEPTVADTTTEEHIQSIRKDVEPTVADTTTEEHTQSIRKDVDATVSDTTTEELMQSIRKDVETTAAGTTTEEHTQSIRKDVETTVAGTTTEKHIEAEGCEKTVADITTEEHIQAIRKDVDATVADTTTEELMQSIRKDVDATVVDTTTEEHIQSIRKDEERTVADTTTEEHIQSIRKDVEPTVADTTTEEHIQSIRKDVDATVADTTTEKASYTTVSAVKERGEDETEEPVKNLDNGMLIPQPEQTTDKATGQERAEEETESTTAEMTTEVGAKTTGQTFEKSFIADEMMEKKALDLGKVLKLSNTLRLISRKNKMIEFEGKPEQRKSMERIRKILSSRAHLWLEEGRQGEKRWRRTITDYLKSPNKLDMSLQLQNGMYDSHVSGDTVTYRTLPQRPFLVNGAMDTPVPMMTYTSVFPYAYIPRLHTKVLEFPLDDIRYKLLILLPVERRGLRQLIYDLRDFPLRNVFHSLRLVRVKATVPSFMVDGFVILTSSLQNLGIWDVFDPRKSNLSGMSIDPELYVRNVEQSVTVVIRNYVEILDIQTRTMAARQMEHNFEASHPFLYFVLDSATKVALMAGQMLDPLNSRIY